MANPWDMDWSQQGQQGQQGNPWEQDWSQTSQQALISGGDPFDELDNPDPSNNPLVGAFQRAAELGAGATDVVGNVFQSAGDVIESLVPPAVTEALTPDFLRVENPFKVAAEGVRRDVEPLYEATVPWEAVKEDPSIGNIATFAAEQGIRSIPDMLAAVNPGTLPGYITARSGELGTIRAENKGLPTAGLQENVEALPGAIASAALERIGGRGALGLGRSAKDIGKQILTRPAQTTLRESAKAVGKAGVKEAATEFGQEQIDYATEVLGTNKVWTLAQSLDRGLAGAVGGGPTGATIRGSVETVRQIAQRKNKAPEDVTIEDVAEEANQGNTAAAEILRSTGASEEQIAAIDETRQQEMANIVEARREEEAARGAPQDAAGFNNRGARRTKEGVLLDRQPRGSVWEDVVRQQKQDEKIALGEMDPAVAPETGRVREPLPDVMPVTPEGQVDVGDAGVTTALERGRGRPTTETALVPQEPQPTRMTPAEIATAQRRMDAGQPRGAAVDEDMDVRRAEDTVFGQEGRAPQTRDDLQGQRQAGGAFTLADRQRQRAGEGVADTQTAGRPEGAAQVDVTLHEGFPVKVTGLQVNPNTNKPEVEIQRYDPRTGEVEPGSEPYIVEAAELQSSRYATDPRRAQDVEARSQVDRVARGKAKGQRIDEFQDLPRQTYRTTEPDPEVQGAEGPFTDVQDRGPGVRADRPPQDEGPSPFKERSTTEEEAIRQAEAFAKEQAQKERARQERAEQARQRGEEPQPEFEDDGGEFESRKSTIKPAKVGKDGYYPTHDYKGVRYVLSDGGGPIIFGTQKQAAKWINKVANIAANDDQFFVFATHPFKQGKPDAKGMSESLYTVVETKRNPEGRKESAQAEASAKAQAESDKTSRRATFAEADAAERASDARRRAQSEPGQQRGIPGEVLEAEPEPEPEPQPEPVSPGGEGALGRVKNPQLWSIPQDQEYKSIKTSINMRRLPVGISKGIKAGYFNDGTINLDIGGGRYDNTTEALIEEGVTNYTYDPFNRTVEENAEAVNNAADGQADTVTVHNTLNTIKEARYRDRVLRQAWSALKPGGRLMITVYAGDKTGQGRATQNNDSWQENRPLSSYLNEVKRHFKNVRQEAGVLIATKDVAAQPQPQPQPQPEPEQPAAPPGDLNPVTQERIEYLNSRADQIDSRASEQEQIIKDAEGKPLDLDANRDQEFRDEAAGIAKNDRESAAKLRKEAQELQQFFSTPDGQRLAREIDEIGKQAEDAGLDRSVIDFSIKSVPRQDVDKQIEFARNQLETLRQRMMGQTGQMPPIPHTPIKDVGEILDPMSKEQGEGSQSSITAEEKKQIIDKINPLLKKLNEMGYNVKDSLDPGNATQAAIDLKRKIIQLAQVQHELGQQRLREDKNIKKISMQGSFSPTKLKFWEEQFDELVGTRDYVRPGSEARDPIQRNDMEKDTAVLNSGEEFPVQYAVVEADELITSQNDDGTVNRSYPQELQPRDRSRGASEMQIQDIANNPNPRLLDKSAKASDGAMIITDEGVVVSGNGRTLGLRRAYDNDNANNYRDHLKQQGYPVDDKVNPVLVRVYQGDPDQLARIAREANERDTMAMSSTEQAMSDARAMSDEVVSLYKGGDIDSAANAAFVRGFIDDVVGRADEAAIRQEGRLSQDGIRRIQSALLAKAFGDENVVSAMTESADNNIKAIGGAMMDVAGVWSQMRQAIQSGNVDPDMDVTEFLLQAVQTVKRARNEKRNIAEFIGQGDIFGSGGIDPLARDFLNLMFRDTKEYGGRSHIGRDKVAEALRFYADEAQKQQAGPGLFGEEAKASPSQILKAAKGKQGGTKQQSEDLFASSEGGFQEGDTTTRQQGARSQGEGSTETAGETKVNQNPTGPKLYGFPGPLFDKEVYKDISRDLKKVLKATTSLTSAVTRPVRNIARTALAASDQHMRADLKERGLLTPTAEKILNMFHAEAGKAGEVDQTFFEAVESRAGEQYNKLSKALGKYVDDAESVAQIVKLLRGNPRALRAGTPLHDAAIEVRKILDENLQYMREAGVEIGEVKTGYFPREMDTDIVMRNQGSFELAAAQAYRETGMNAKAARDAAAALYEELIFGHLNSPRQGGGASAPFVRGRVFTKAVDNESHPLNKFLVQDHVGSLTQYLGRATRRAEIARRFGDNFANMADLEQQLKDEGSGEIIPELAAHIEIMTGTAVRGQRGDLKMLQNIRMWSALMYLERATLSSLGEIVMPAVRTGNALDLGSAFAETIKGFRKQNKSEARDMAEDLGIITGHVGESIMTSRYAGEDISGQKTARVLDRYFRRIGLEQFTEATRVASTKIGNVFIRRMAKRIAAGGDQAKLSTEFLAELGVPAAKAQEFSAWMMKSDGFPTDISGEMGSIYKKAIWRFVDQTIMRPNKSVKPKWANSNLGQVVYHLQAFTLTFYQNVVKRSGRLAKRAATERGLSVADRARLVAPALMLPVLFAFQAAISEIRDELTMDEERRKKETGTTRLLKWASRTGLFGAADPYVNLVQASSRYNRSAIDSLIGPGLGAAGKAADATLAVTLNDSPTTNTQERKMMRAFYDVALEPMLNYQLSQRIGPAAGPIARATGAAITQIAGAGKTKEVFLSATVGPYKKSGSKSSRWARPTR